MRNPLSIAWTFHKQSTFVTPTQSHLAKSITSLTRASLILRVCSTTGRSMNSSSCSPRVAVKLHAATDRLNRCSTIKTSTIKTSPQVRG
ncbi:hypothetical protein BOTBODRAFT_418215 [Botryobasidium botryosum FD-172 SS1]|uniref:Uncharacterized protein n=1 Tax=Botryobasidium botryosum (strain FD-172 SS1) TaxID=930990 RepID=A0A067MLS9_BOTB1|nr:hypothetical protein BOTBODRAFT_418215 [Botryobasidium botryosum FD-172 SS1]